MFGDPSTARRDGIAVFTLMTVLGIGECVQPGDLPSKSNQSSPETQATNTVGNGKAVILIVPGAGMGSTGRLEFQDAEAIVKTSSDVIVAAPVIRVRASIAFGRREWVPFRILGTTPEYLTVRNLEKLAEGKAFSPQETRDAAPVCLIGQSLVRELFADESPVGRYIQIKDKPLRVIGVLAKIGRDYMGLDQDDLVLAPWTTLRELFPRTDRQSVDLIFAKAVSEQRMSAAIRQITQTLRDRHQVGQADPDDFTIKDFAASVSSPKP